MSKKITKSRAEKSQGQWSAPLPEEAIETSGRCYSPTKEDIQDAENAERELTKIMSKHQKKEMK